MTKRVSINMKYGIYAVYVIALVMLVNLVRIVTDEGAQPGEKVIFFFAAILAVLLTLWLTKYLVRTFPDVSFDESNLYVRQPRAKSHIIALERITGLKMTSISLNNRQQIQIDYTNLDNKAQSIKFFPRIGYLHLEGLAEQIKRNNKAAKIQRLSVGPFQIETYTD